MFVDRMKKTLMSLFQDDWSSSHQPSYSSSGYGDNSGYQNTSNSLPTPQHQQQSKSDENVFKYERDPSFESWLNEETKPKPSSATGRSTSSKKTSHSSSSKSKATPAPAPVPAPNLISFDDEKWADDDDAGWESIDTK